VSPLPQDTIAAYQIRGMNWRFFGDPYPIDNHMTSTQQLWNGTEWVEYEWISPTADNMPPRWDGTLPDPEPDMTVGEVAEQFSRSTKTIRQWCDAGKLRSTRTRGGHRRFNRGDVERYSASQTKYWLWDLPLLV